MPLLQQIADSLKKIDLMGTLVTFNSWTDTCQISAAPNFWYLILLVPFWKMISFETKWVAFLKQICTAFCFLCILLQKQCGMLTRHYYLKTVPYRLSNDLTFSLNINTDYTLYKHSHFPLSGVCFYDVW